jgi:hypothetical protein
LCNIGAQRATALFASGAIEMAVRADDAAVVGGGAGAVI